MPEFLIASPFKWQGEVKQQGMITLTAEEAEPLVCSGSLIPLIDGIELADTDQLFTIDEVTGEMTPVTDSELQTMVVDAAAAVKSVYVVADGRTVELFGKSFTERQFMLLAAIDAAPLLECGDVLSIEQVAESIRQSDLAEEQRKAEEARLAEEKRKADEAARLAEEKRLADEEKARLAKEQKDNKKKAKGDAAQS